ncbi:hypothetical protein ACS0TY_006664 [Phlomoides rotata]
MWMSHPSFTTIVTVSWSQGITSYCPIHRVTHKLKRLKITLRNWNKITFRNIYAEMKAASEALVAIQAETTQFGDSDERLLEDRDRNSKFFHTMNRIRKTSFGLSSLLVDGELTFDPRIISDSVVQFYTELFTSIDQDPFDDTILGEFIQLVVDPGNNDMLTVMRDVEEIKRAVFDMDPSSSPGPDGFGGSFYQTCWDIIALDVIEAVRITQIPRAPRYLLYADDNLIFARATTGNIRRLQAVLSAYGGLSGQVYNPTKSKVYFGSAIPRSVRNYMLRTTGITHGSLPISYLVVPIFRGAARVSHLAPLADSIISKFAKWKGHSLSLAGQKCMINSMISASLVHSMMVYYWPRTLMKKIETTMRNFLWTRDISYRNNSYTVSWARVCAPLEEGGSVFGLSAMPMTPLSVSLLGISSTTRLLICLCCTIDIFLLWVGLGIWVVPPLSGQALVVT